MPGIYMFSDQFKSDLMLLKKRSFLTPSYLSLFISTSSIQESLNIEVIVKEERNLENYDLNSDRTHTYEYSYISGLETLDVQSKHTDTVKHQVFFPTWGQDGLNDDLVKTIAKGPNSNYIFWNYPKIGASHGSLRHADDLIHAGCQQVARLKELGVKAEDITLSGKTFGGHVAAEVALYYHLQNYPVKLMIEETGISLSSEEMLNGMDTPYFSAGMTGTFLGASLGLIFAGLVSTAGLLLASCIEFLGVFMANSCHAMGAEYLAYGSYSSLNMIAYGVNSIFSCIGSIIGVLVSLVGNIAGGIILGMVLGGVLTGLEYMTHNKVLMPHYYAFSVLQYVTHCEFSTLDTIRRLQANNSEAIDITNSPILSEALNMNENSYPNRVLSFWCCKASETPALKSHNSNVYQSI